MELEDNLFSMSRETNEATALVSIEALKGDITKREIDVIVNAAHEDLTGGGGVDGAIHEAAGQQLIGECLSLYGCFEGEARITGAYNLPAKYIIHTVGPVWVSNKESQEISKEVLANCYKNCLEIAERQGLKGIAFPCISTGAYCFPKALAAEIAVQTVWRWLRNYIMYVKNEKGCYLQLVEFVCFDDESLELYEQAIKKEEDYWTFLKCHRNDGFLCVHATKSEECRRPKDKNCMRDKYEDIKVDFLECYREDGDACDYMRKGFGCFRKGKCVKDKEP